MKRLAIIVSLLLAGTGAAAKTPSEHGRVHGEWSGRGETAGQAFTACAKFAPYMNNVYLHLDYRVNYDAGTSLPAQQTESFYVFLDEGKVEGVTLDNASNVFQINGTYSDQTMSTRWLKNGNAVGKSEWRLSQDGNTLLFMRYGLMPDGELKEIGEVKMTRVTDGKRCAK